MSAAGLPKPLAGLAGLTRVAAGATASPDVVVYESRGCVLVLGDDASAGEVAQRMAAHHTTVVFAPGVDVRDWGPRVTAVSRQVTHLTGYLGAFQAGIQVDDEVTDIGAASPNPGRYFDLVLDLSAKPLLRAEVKPYGYFAPGTDEAALTEAIAAMQTLVGHFSKLRYFNYVAQLCAHGSSGITGCDRCLNVCSALAIRSAGDSIVVDPHVCQGCASCTLSCPTGALTMKAPDRQTLGERLQVVLTDAGPGVTLLVHALDLDVPTQSAWAQHRVVFFQVNPLSALGDELWLRALALGANNLVLLDDASLHEKTRALLGARVDQMQILLKSAGHSPSRLAFVKPDNLTHWLQTHSSVNHQHAKASAASPLKSWFKFKRLAWVDGLRQLGGDVTAQPQPLPTGAPLGAVHVDANRCTLCFACVNLCPTRALNARNEALQQLVFQESACVQCGLCVKVCPEQAVTLQPRVAAQALAQMTAVVLHQDEQFKCTSCGTPFISRKLLESGLKRIKDHPVLAQGGLDALKTCPSCRQRAMLES